MATDPLSPRDAAAILRQRFPGLDSDTSYTYDPVGAIKLRALREGRAGELADVRRQFPSRPVIKP